MSGRKHSSKVPKAKSSSSSSSSGGKGSKKGKGKGRRSHDDMDRERRHAWARAFSAEHREHEALKALHEAVERHKESGGVEYPKHLVDKYLELLTKYDEEGRQCAVCLESITFQTAHMTKCAHTFHIKCFEDCVVRDPRCPVCRDKYVPKPKSPPTASTSASTSASTTPITDAPVASTSAAGTAPTTPAAPAEAAPVVVPPATQ